MNKGDKYIIEIAEVQECHDDNGNAFELGRVKGFKALTLDESALKKLEPLRHGHWEPYLTEGLIVKCSECGSRFDRPWHYCPACGSKMDGEDNEEQEILAARKGEE